jgi:hypothetical protein
MSNDLLTVYLYRHFILQKVSIKKWAIINITEMHISGGDQGRLTCRHCGTAAPPIAA